MNDMKTEMLRVRMTPEEKAALHRQASLHRKSMSEYIRIVAKCASTFKVRSTVALAEIFLTGFLPFSDMLCIDKFCFV